MKSVFKKGYANGIALSFFLAISLQGEIFAQKKQFRVDTAYNLGVVKPNPYVSQTVEGFGPKGLIFTFWEYPILPEKATCYTTNPEPGKTDSFQKKLNRKNLYRRRHFEKVGISGIAGCEEALFVLFSSELVFYGPNKKWKQFGLHKLFEERVLWTNMEQTGGKIYVSGRTLNDQYPALCAAEIDTDHMSVLRKFKIPLDRRSIFMMEAKYTAWLDDTLWMVEPQKPILYKVTWSGNIVSEIDTIRYESVHWNLNKSSDFVVQSKESFEVILMMDSTFFCNKYVNVGKDGVFLFVSDLNKRYLIHDISQGKFKVDTLIEGVYVHDSTPLVNNNLLSMGLQYSVKSLHYDRNNGVFRRLLIFGQYVPFFSKELVYKSDLRKDRTPHPLRTYHCVQFSLQDI